MQENFIIHPEYSQIATKLHDALTRFSEIGEYVTKGERNVIKRVEIDGFSLNIKKFKTPNAIQSFVYQFIRKSKAKRSYEYALKLIDFGIKTPFPVAYFESFDAGLKESFYVSAHVNYDFDFRVLIHKPKFKNRTEILKQFTQFTFRLHENGVNFLDHSPGNTLIIDNGDNTYDFYLIDLNRMRFEDMTFENRMHNFRRLWLSKTMIKIMAEEYAKCYGKSFEETHAMMLKYSRSFQKAKNSKKLRKRRRKNFL
ncbi:lipopolysaccharide kinase InaA family protein [Aequorivita sp. F47161]|uniref:Lipopolysaccharide kinase InaA family protein n=1 Tax=Aequorivita vitellina TaxID=2874475 RepID=A0A9X1R133_9FLAO|nr:lipopolysaccharide kinase InaA family protein [Aequorivita vitellina]MCG2420254.1 lipopolysaccharide kinase InaA family protein [Aequorivita vitellina]